ncbi:hypothetical protein MRX96_007513 [Rhipicephalus microplus]
MRHKDILQANLIQNNFAYCPPDLGRAEWVLQVKEITIDNKDYEVSVYSAPYDSSGHGVILGVNLRLNRDTIQAELQDKRHPTLLDFRFFRRLSHSKQLCASDGAKQLFFFAGIPFDVPSQRRSTCVLTTAVLLA